MVFMNGTLPYAKKQILQKQTNDHLTMRKYLQVFVSIWGSSSFYFFVKVVWKLNEENQIRL